MGQLFYLARAARATKVDLDIPEADWSEVLHLDLHRLDDPQAALPGISSAIPLALPAPEAFSERSA